MKKWNRITRIGLFLLVSAIPLLLIGCGSDEVRSGSGEGGVSEAPSFEGMIYSVDEEGKSILVVAGIESAEIPEEEWYGKDAVSFYLRDEVKIFNQDGKEVSFEELKQGQKVKVYHSGELRESYPMQGDALLVEIIG